MKKEQYIENLLNYIKKNNISINEYYRNYAMKIRSGKKFNLEDWELKNPFISGDDIKRIIAYQDNEICNYFADSFEKIIELNIKEINKNRSLTRKDIQETIDETMDRNLTRKDIKEAIDEKIESHLTRKDIKEAIDEKMGKTSKIIITSMSPVILSRLNGFAVIKESKTGRVDLFYHDAEKEELKAKSTFINNQLNVESGYYVNYSEFINNLIDKAIEQYPNTEKMIFVRNDGVEKTPSEVSEEAFAIARKEGAISFGKQLQQKEIKTYKEYVEMNNETKEEYRGEHLKTGFYVRRDVLARIFNKYRIMLTLSDTNNIQENKTK